MIFKSKYPDIKIPQVGIYQYVTSNPYKISDDKIIYVDCITGKSYTFGEFKHESKKFAAGLQDKLGLQQELSYHLTDSGASILIVHPEFFEAAIEASINAKIPTFRVLLFGDKEIKRYKPYRSILTCDREIEPVNYTPEEAKSTTAYIVYSSGSTGKPKGVERTHTNVTASLAQLTSVDDKLGPHSVIMGVTVSHIKGFNLETFCESIQKYKITHIYATPSTILELVNNPLTQKFDLSSVDSILCGGARLDYKLERKFYEKFKISVLQGYGYNELGELWVHGPNVMKGYLNNKEATDAVFDKDGFFSSGDIVSVDEQELINYKGFQVIPSELEYILLTHDAVADAVVLGYFSEEEATEIPIAYVAIKNGYEQSQSLAREIQFFVDENVAPHKKLRGGILLIDKIPKSVTGKVLKTVLKEKLKNDKRIKMN
ncbi:9806_t:CDS:2 [Racocetra fulgida]|uniref:9806_t:CDS:1 n=1 Tax=Racocetra fulgida TaxID=60492 RepID=A0A9N9AS17_9GLOM|nr:9806_t:CDS:2 [Racocetra fulgida]